MHHPDIANDRIVDYSSDSALNASSRNAVHNPMWCRIALRIDLVDLQLNVDRRGRADPAAMNGYDLYRRAASYMAYMLANMKLMRVDLARGVRNALLAKELLIVAHVDGVTESEALFP